MSPTRKIYRVCLYDARFRSLSAELIEAASDEEAVRLAEAAGPGATGEVWRGTRLVARLGGKLAPPPPLADPGLAAAAD